MLFSSAVTLIDFLAVQPLVAFIQPLPVYGWSLAMALFATVIPVFALSAAIRSIGAGRPDRSGTWLVI